MASINIYINDTMKEEMASVEANWSEVCRQAITAEITKFKGDQVTYEPQNFDIGDWDYCSFERSFNSEGVIIKPYVDHPDPNIRNTVKIASQWLEEIKRELQIARLDGNSLAEFFQGVRRVEILEPGKTWKTGYLKINFQLYFYFQNEEEKKDTLEAEIIENSELKTITMSSMLTTQQSSQFISISELQKLGIINVDLHPVDSENESTKIPPFTAKIYIAFKRAWFEVYQDNLIPSSLIKNLWTDWYQKDLTDLFWHEYWDEEKLMQWEREDTYNSKIQFLSSFESHYIEENSSHIPLNYLLFMAFINNCVFNPSDFYQLTDLTEEIITNYHSGLNFVKMHEKDLLPQEAGVYFLIQGKNIFSLGVTSNLYEHWYEHKLGNIIDNIPELEIRFVRVLSNKYLHKIYQNFVKNHYTKINLNNNPFLVQ